MDCENKRLIVSFSNGIQWSGVMSISLAKEQADSVYPDREIAISIFEIVITNETDFSLELVSARNESGWKDRLIQD